LFHFNFKIIYRPEKQGAKPDALTKRSEDLLKKGNERLLHQSQVVLKKANLDDFLLIGRTPEEQSVKPPPIPPQIPEIPELIPVAAPEITPEPARSAKQIRFADPILKLYPITRNQFRGPKAPGHQPQFNRKPPRPALPAERTAPLLPSQIQDLFDLGYDKDKKLKSIILALKKRKPRYRKISLAECELSEEYLYYRERLYVPANEKLHAELLRLYHASPVAGHMGQARTYKVLSRKYYWPGMLSYVERWVRNCHTCKRTIASKKSPLRSSETPSDPPESLARYFYEFYHAFT
jgi:hypothetical protein